MLLQPWLLHFVERSAMIQTVVDQRIGQRNATRQSANHARLRLLLEKGGFVEHAFGKLHCVVVCALACGCA